MHTEVYIYNSHVCPDISSSRLKNKDNFIYQIILVLVNVNMQAAVCYVYERTYQYTPSKLVTVISIHSKCFVFTAEKRDLNN